MKTEDDLGAAPQGRPPRDNLVRAMPRGSVEVRAAEDPAAPPTMFGHFAVFNEWTRISSFFEGEFMERIAPGAFSKTFAENRDAIRVTFNHGSDPQLGDKVLGNITALREDKQGAYYEVPLFESVDPLLREGLAAGAYGASFRFRVMKEELVEDPEPSDENPRALPERTIKEAQVMEFGPVTFPAYAAATVGVRSLTDEFVMDRMTHGEGLRKFADYVEKTRKNGAGAEPHSTKPPVDTTEEVPEVETENEFRTADEIVAEQAALKAELERLDKEHTGRVIDGDSKTRWNELLDKFNDLEARRKDMEERARVIGLVAGREANVEQAVSTPTREKDVQIMRDRRLPENIYALDEYRARAGSLGELLALQRDGAMRSVEGAEFPSASRFPGAPTREDLQAHVQKLLDTVDYDDPEHNKVGGEIARRILSTGSPEYRRAFGKYLSGQAMSPEEQRALSFASAATGGAAVVYTLDPTIVPTSNFSVNPWRALGSVEQIAGTNEWKAVTSGAITASYAAEVTEASDNAPTLAQPDIIVEKAQAFVPYSIEIGQDWERLQTEMANLLQDSKDDLEATKFALGAGHGSQEPKGVITGATNTVGTTTTAAFVIADLYKLFEALPPRFRPRAQFAANLFIIDKIRQFDTSGGSGVYVGPQGLQADLDAGGAGSINSQVRAPLLGRGLWEATAMASALTTTSKIILAGDFRYFKIIDRVGMNIEVVPLLVGTAHRPTGQRGLYAYWRNSSDVLSAAAFEVLVT